MVEILKQPGQTIGVYISEGDRRYGTGGIFISRISDGSLVGNDDLLHVGDEILCVNGVGVTDMTVDNVVVLMAIPRVLVLRLRTRQANVRFSPDRYGYACKDTNTTTSESVGPAHTTPSGDSKRDDAECIQNKFEEVYHEKQVRCDNYQEYRDDIECLRIANETEANESPIRRDRIEMKPSHCQHESRLNHDGHTRQQEMPGWKPERRTPTSPGGGRFQHGYVRGETTRHARQGSTSFKMKSPVLAKTHFPNEIGYYSANVDTILRVHRRNLHSNHQGAACAYRDETVQTGPHYERRTVVVKRDNLPDGYTSDPEQGVPRYSSSSSTPRNTGIVWDDQPTRHSPSLHQQGDRTAVLRHWLHEFAKLSKELQMLNDSIHHSGTQGKCVQHV